MKINPSKLAKALALTDKDHMSDKLINCNWYDIPFYKKLEYIGEAQRIIKALKWMKKMEKTNENQQKRIVRNP